MQRICIETFSKDGLTFHKGLSYKIEYNNVDGRIYVYTIWGYTNISKSALNNYFL